jgi:hypothetical protein
LRWPASSGTNKSCCFCTRDSKVIERCRRSLTLRHCMQESSLLACSRNNIFDDRNTATHINRIASKGPSRPFVMARLPARVQQVELADLYILYRSCVRGSTYGVHRAEFMNRWRSTTLLVSYCTLLTSNFISTNILAEAT